MQQLELPIGVRLEEKEASLGSKIKAKEPLIKGKRPNKIIKAVLRELGDRNGVDDLKTLSSIMIQVDKFGTSIGTALRTQSDAMRVRRRQIAEEKAAKTAVKLIFPLVIFIFPGIFVVLVGPAAITMVNEMLPALQK